MISALCRMKTLLGPVHEFHSIFDEEPSWFSAPDALTKLLQREGGEGGWVGGPRGRQPHNCHDVNEPLLLALQKERTSTLPLGAGLSASAATVSALDVAMSENGPLLW